MIPYADLERAIARWKVRQGGGVDLAAPIEQPVKEVSARAIVAEVPVAIPEPEVVSVAETDIDEAYAEVSAEQVLGEGSTIAADGNSYVSFDATPPPVTVTVPEPSIEEPAKPIEKKGRRRKTR
jgi:hypothetical protein